MYAGPPIPPVPVKDMPARWRTPGTWIRRLQRALRDKVGGRARLRVIVLLACVLGLDSADKATVGAVATELEKSLHIGNTQIGLLATVSSLVGAVATLPAGMLTDRFSRTRLLSISIVLWCLAMVASGAAVSYLMLLLTRLLLGIVIATAGPAVASLTGDLFPAMERGRIYGFILSGELLGAGLGLIVSGDIAAAGSWRFSFWVMAIPGLVLALAITRLLPEPARGGQSRLEPGAEKIRGEHDGGAQHTDDDHESAVRQEIRRDENIHPHERLVLHEDPTDRSLWWAIRYVLSIRTNVALIIASALGYFFFSGIRTFAVVYLRGRYGLGQSTASSLLVLVGMGAIAGVLLSGRISDRLIGRHHVAARPVVAGIAFLIAAVLFVPGLFASTVLLAAALFVLAAAGLGAANPPVDAARLDLVHHRLWGRADSVRTVLRAGLEATAPLLFGYISVVFGGSSAGFGNPSGGTSAGGAGLQQTFLIMLIPVAVAGLLLVVYARATYPRDVATATASEDAVQETA